MEARNIALLIVSIMFALALTGVSGYGIYYGKTNSQTTVMDLSIGGTVLCGVCALSSCAALLFN